MTDADDKESVDRAFAELVAGFHLTAERPEPDWDGPTTGRAPAPGSVFELPTPLPPAIRPTSQSRGRPIATTPVRRPRCRDPPGPCWSAGSASATRC